MPATLPRNAWLVVMDEQGKVLRSELLAPGTDLSKRLADMAAEYVAQGWIGQPSPQRWSFIMRNGPRRLAIGIRAAKPGEPSLS
jgi:hypothetical protein